MEPAPAFIGRYEILEEIASGAFGRVLCGRDPDIDRKVAIKLIKATQDDPESRERFTREARAAGRLHHVNIVTIFELGSHYGDPFIVMEYLGGETLESVIERRAPLTLTNKLWIVEQLCAGISFAH